MKLSSTMFSWARYFCWCFERYALAERPRNSYVILLCNAFAIPTLSTDDLVVVAHFAQPLQCHQPYNKRFQIIKLDVANPKRSPKRGSCMGSHPTPRLASQAPLGFWNLRAQLKRCKSCRRSRCWFWKKDPLQHILLMSVSHLLYGWIFPAVFGEPIWTLCFWLVSHQRSRRKNLQRFVFLALPCPSCYWAKVASGRVATAHDSNGWSD